MRIVFFDSGIGGLTVLREACRRLPGESYVYYADTRNVPYGVHSKEEVYSFVERCMDEILAVHDVKAVVLACNTATSAAAEILRKRYRFPIVGMEPAVKPALQSVAASGKRVIVTATPLTLKEQKFQKLVGDLDKHGLVDTLALPELVQFAEEGLFDGPTVERYLREQFGRFHLEDVGAVVLGCTHFLFFRQVIRHILPAGIALFDGNAGTVNRLRSVLGLPDPDGMAISGSEGSDHDKPLSAFSGRFAPEPDIRFMSSLGTRDDELRLNRYFRLSAE
jgi:glutamate racemase